MLKTIDTQTLKITEWDSSLWNKINKRIHIVTARERAPANSALHSQVIDEQVERGDSLCGAVDKGVPDTHAEVLAIHSSLMASLAFSPFTKPPSFPQMCSPAQFRQQSAELYAVIDEILADSIPAVSVFNFVICLMSKCLHVGWIQADLSVWNLLCRRPSTPEHPPPSLDCRLRLRPNCLSSMSSFFTANMQEVYS